MSETKENKLLQCYNKGCGQEFDPDKNHAEACTFHPGAPVFHDAYKGWSCCNKKCTDFTEFLNIKGCKKSYHDNVKPVEPEKQKANNSYNEEVVTSTAPKLTKQPALERPSHNTPMIKLPVTVTSSLKQLLDKLKNETTADLTETSGDGSAVVTVGTSCKNGGCRKEYEGEHSNSQTCEYHPGVPIFHEGLKYWSCCKKKTTDFNSFLDQQGCTTGFHIWIKASNEVEKVTCRYDWHQTGSHVIISIYAKGADPELSYVAINPVKIHMVVTFGNSVFDEELILRGIIDVEKSDVTMAGTKVEIKLKKAEFFSWEKLNLPKETNENNTDDVDLNSVSN